MTNLFSMRNSRVALKRNREFDIGFRLTIKPRIDSKYYGVFMESGSMEPAIGPRACSGIAEGAPSLNAI